MLATGAQRVVGQDKADDAVVKTFEQESDDVTSRLVMQFVKKPAASSEHWHCGPLH